MISNEQINRNSASPSTDLRTTTGGPSDAGTSVVSPSNDVHTYTVIWALLMLFTAITVAVAQINLGKLAIIVCLAVASFKSILVLLYFMHLRHEENRVIRLIIPIVIIALAIFIGLTFTDVIAR